MGRKYASNKDPTKNKDFPFKPLGEYQLGQYRNKAKFIWDQWNRNRMRDGLPRVDPPIDLELGVTFRPPP